MNRHSRAAQICVLVVVSYSNRVTMVARHDGHTMVVGSGPTFGLEMITVVGSILIDDFLPENCSTMLEVRRCF